MFKRELRKLLPQGVDQWRRGFGFHVDKSERRSKGNFGKAGDLEEDDEEEDEEDEEGGGPNLEEDVPLDDEEAD